MATVSKRRHSLIDPSAEKELQTFAMQYFPGAISARMMDEISKTGTVSQKTFDDAGITASNAEFMRGEIQRITGGKPTQGEYTQNELKQQTDSNVNEANLTDEELKNRQQAFNELGQTPGTVDKASVDRFIDDKLKTFGITDKDQTVRNGLTEFVIKNGRLPDAGELRDSITASGGQGYSVISDPKVSNFLQDQDNKNQFSDLVKGQVNAPDTTGDISRIEDILGTRGQEATNEAGIKSYLTTLPDVLSNSRNDYLSAIREQGNQQIQEVTPQILASANARGALFSGDVPDILSNYAGNVQGGIESQQAQLEAEDNQFYFNAAYQNALRQNLQGQQDYSTYLAGERSNVLNEQNTRFQRSQSTLQANAQNDLLQRQYNNQLTAQQLQLRKQGDLEKSQKTTNKITGIGQSIGGIATTVAGAYTGNPALVATGASITAGGVSKAAS